MMNDEQNGQQIAYFLEDNKDLSETGYKVMRTHENIGFLTCHYLYYNGRVKLIYDRKELIPLSNAVRELSAERYVEVVLNLFDLLIKIKEIGFLQYRNVVISKDKIFVDTNSLKVSIIYLPLDIKQDVDFRELERNIYTVLCDMCAYYSQVGSQIINKLYQLIMNNTPMDSMKEEIRNYERLERQQIGEIVFESDEIDKKEKVKGKKQKKERKGLFSRRKKDNDESRGKEYRIRIEGGATQILDSGFIPQIKLQYAGKENIEIIIDKEEYSIGKQEGAVDYVLLISNAISRVHCKMITINYTTYIEDLKSSNGTFVNGKKIPAGEKVPLNVGDRVIIANKEFIVSGI